MYVGKLKGCTIYADLDGDLAYSEGEPTSTTDDHGGWSLVVEAMAQTGAVIVVPAGEDQLPGCQDRNTNLSLSVTVKALAGCEVVSTLSALQYIAVKNHTAGGMSVANATTEANRAIAASLGLTDATNFDVCTYNHIAEVYKDAIGSGRRLETANELVAAVLSLVIKLTALVSGVASVTGFEGAATYKASADAISASVVKQFIAHSGTASAGDLVEIDTAALVSAAVEASGVTLGASLHTALANSCTARAEYLANKTATSLISATDALTVLTQIATFGVVSQAEDPAVDALLANAKAAGSSDLSRFASATELEAELVEASTPTSLELQVNAVTVPTPEQAPSPPPPPPPSSPPSPPPPPPPLSPINPLLSDPDANVETESNNVVAWASLVLLLPFLCLGYVFFRYPGKAKLWFKYRFSHSSPATVILYKPKDVRCEMRSALARVDKFGAAY